MKAAPSDIPPTPAPTRGEPAPARVISYEEASEIVENAQNLPPNEHDNR